jgi:hypothetical protein
MKGVSTEIVLLIAIVIIVAALLFYAWSKGFLPFGVGVTEAECHTDIMKECSDMRISGDTSRLKAALNRCWGYITKLPSYSNCNDCRAAGGTMDKCSDCCAKDLAGWTE